MTQQEKLLQAKIETLRARLEIANAKIAELQNYIKDELRKGDGPA